ncbi:hypothetical protein Acsp04_66020 [Actinomadura sp. NBRC 104425]|uniref:hypothetical protein n=1 Tax=Actinomadura sp. NBRC 104425 TaxID=3032204 RepID=UPI0024A5FAE2|nr:hypothetical protein [Actinomadura sp. NBRC 104425]GLZ16367.1 hypothetical protein Acsp04_66020 [Actinomadura sp. NBRC 104425]
MTTQQHPDPITEGFTHSGERMIQIITMAAALEQGYVRHLARLAAAKATRDAAEKRMAAELKRAALAEARARWARAHDRNWLRQASLVDTAETWAAAVPYAADEQAAASAVRKCEERLRDLHPHAMSHYDRFRARGETHLGAMKLAAPYFTRDPHVRTGQPMPQRPELAEGSGAQWAATVHGPHLSDLEEARREQRGHQIVTAILERLRAEGREPHPGELRTILEATTNLPDHAIAKLVPEPAAASPEAATQVRLAADGFPFSIDEALAMHMDRPAEAPAVRRTPRQSPDRNRRRNL